MFTRSIADQGKQWVFTNLLKGGDLRKQAAYQLRFSNRKALSHPRSACKHCPIVQEKQPFFTNLLGEGRFPFLKLNSDFFKKLLTTRMLVYIIKNVFDSGQQYMIP